MRWQQTVDQLIAAQVRQVVVNEHCPVREHGGQVAGLVLGRRTAAEQLRGQEAGVRQVGAVGGAPELGAT